MGLLDRWTKKTTAAQMKSEKPAEKKTKTVVKPAAAVVKKEEKTVSDKKAKQGGIAHRVLVHAMVTEKSAIAESHNKYTFTVARFATKPEVKRAVEAAYGVAPIAVHMANYNGKTVRFGRTKGRRSDYKKAVVTLPAGKTINLHEGV